MRRNITFISSLIIGLTCIVSGCGLANQQSTTTDMVIADSPYTLDDLKDSVDSMNYKSVLVQSTQDGISKEDNTNKTQQSIIINFDNNQIAEMQSTVTHYFSNTDSNTSSIINEYDKQGNLTKLKYYLNYNKNVLFYTEDSNTDFKLADEKNNLAKDYITTLTSSFKGLNPSDIKYSTYDVQDVTVDKDTGETLLYDVVGLYLSDKNWSFYVNPNTKQVDIVMLFTYSEGHTEAFELLTLESDIGYDIGYTEVETANQDLMHLLQAEICKKFLNLEFDSVITGDVYNTMLTEVLYE